MIYLFNQILKLYTMAYDSVERVLRGFYGKDDQLSILPKIRHLKAGDRVKARNGIIGKVLRTYRSKDTDQLVACTVVWDEKNEGNEISMLVLIEDLDVLE